MTEKPDCYKCAHRRNVPGSAHSACKNPRMDSYIDDPIISMLGVMKALPPHVALPLMGKLGVAAKAHGIVKGWFQWPFNFDPVWLLTCDGFEEAKTSVQS